MTIRGVSNKYRALYYHPLDLTPETLLTQAFIQSVSNLTDGHRPGAVGSDWGWTRAFDIRNELVGDFNSRVTRWLNKV
eukprot:3253094-Pyramimonas_sp.AAC.1